MLSGGDISLPTPIMAGLRTKVKQFSSCVLVETADTLDSISATTDAIVKYVSRKMRTLSFSKKTNLWQDMSAKRKTCHYH